MATPAISPAVEPLHEYAFDLELIVALRVKATSHEQALRTLRDTLDCADSHFGAWPDGSPVLGEASLRGTPRLYETTDPTIPDAEKAVPPIRFEPWTDELRAALESNLSAWEGEEESVQEEKAALILANNALLEAFNCQGSREAELLAHLTMAYYTDCDDADEIPFRDWLLSEVLALEDGLQIKALAKEYLALAVDKRTKKQA